MQVSVRMSETLGDRLDTWRQIVKPPPTRPEAIRRLVYLGFMQSAQPIQTAPKAKRGEEYPLILFDGKRSFVGSWSAELKGWFVDHPSNDVTTHQIDPTHWAYLPEGFQ